MKQTALEFKQKLKEYIDLQYERLKETRNLEKSFEALNIWEKKFKKIEIAESILLEYIETLKYTKKRWFGKPEVLYRDVKDWEFYNFYLEKGARYSGHGTLSDEQNRKGYMDFMDPLREAQSILNQIIKSK
jgi:hypothetical protein